VNPWPNLVFEPARLCAARGFARVNVFIAPMTVANVGRWSVLADPQGAVFSLFQAY